MKFLSYSKLIGFRVASTLLLGLGILSSNIIPVSGQQAQTPAPPALNPKAISELERLRDAALTSPYAYEQASFLCNNIGPRLSGSAQAQRAVEYVAEQMRTLGLAVRLEPVKVPHWVRGAETGTLVQFPGMAPGTTQKVVLTALGGSVATPETGITAPVIVVQSFAELEALDQTKVAGRIVLFNHVYDRRMAAQGYGFEAYRDAVIYRAFGPSAAARKGALAVFVRSAGGSQNRLAHTGALRYADDAGKIPAAAVSAEDADMIATLARQGEVVAHLLLTPKTLEPVDSFNVIADLKGSDLPDQVVIVSGHLDSWDLGTGAIDDASGVVVAMQAVQLVKRMGLKPKRTIRFIAWMNEENGTAGATAYAADEAANMANHFAAIESDSGAGHPLGFNFFGKQEALDSTRQISAVLQIIGAGLSKRTDGIETDVAPLGNAHVPAFGLWQDARSYFNYHHTAADTFDKIDPHELAENAAVMTVLAYGLASMEQPLAR